MDNVPLDINNGPKFSAGWPVTISHSWWEHLRDSFGIKDLEHFHLFAYYRTSPP